MTELPLFPVTVVGSWPRPPWLVEALQGYQAGRTSAAEFREVADRAVLEALRYQEEAGVDIVSDGEQRRDNFYSFVTEKLEGVRLMTLAEMLDHVEDKAYFDQLLRQLDAPSFSIRNATVTGRIRPRGSLAVEEVEFLRRHTHRPIKVALPGPYLLARSMWVKGLSDAVYPSADDLADDLVPVLREEVLRLRAAGAAFVQFDEPILSEVALRPPVHVRTFMCAAIAVSEGDPEEELVKAARLLNRVVEGIDGVRLGVHICRGNWSRKEDVLLSGDYGPLLPYLALAKVDQWVLEFGTPRAGELEALRPLAGTRELGLGAVNPRTTTVETSAEVRARAEGALALFQPGQVFLNPDCGFGTFAERPVNDAETAAHKLAVLAEAAAELRRQYAAS